MRITQTAYVAWFWFPSAMSQVGDDDACSFSDGSGACCYKIAASVTGGSSATVGDPIAYGYSLSAPYNPPQNDNWGWGSDEIGGPLFNYVESQQFIFSIDDFFWNEDVLLSFSVSAQECGAHAQSDPAPHYRALWQGGSANGSPDASFHVNYTRYIESGGEGKKARSHGDPIYVTFIPCVDKACTDFDPSRAVAAMISFRHSDEDPCQGAFGGSRGYDCCYIGQSIAADASQSEIDHAITVTDQLSQPVHKSCLTKPHWQCYDEAMNQVDFGSESNVSVLRYKGSLVDFVLDKDRLGRGLRVVLADNVTVNMALGTTYIDYTVDPEAPDSCNDVCKNANGRPSFADITLHGGSCQLSRVSSFAAVNGGMVSVGGFGRIDGLHAMGDPTYWADSTDADPLGEDRTPGDNCPTCNRFCPMTPYAWGLHALSTCCNTPTSECTSTLKMEAGDARYHIDSGLLELSSDSRFAPFAVDISDVTVSNPLKRGDGGVMVQSPGHFVQSFGCQHGTLEEQQKENPCQGPNLPARAFGLKYMGAWHDAVDGPSMKSEGSEYLYMYVQCADDTLKPYSRSLVRDSTVIHGGVGGAVTPCTYNLQSYTPGCSESKTLNTHIVRILDASAGYETPQGRGGLFASRYCAGKTNLAWSSSYNEGVFAGNIVDGLVVELLGDMNQVGRAVGIVVDAPQDGNQVYFCQKIHEELPLVFHTNAFVFKNWNVEVPVDNSVDGSGAVLVDTRFAMSATFGKSLAVFDEDRAIDVTGLRLRIPPDGMNCGYSGEYYPCMFSSDSDSALDCYVRMFSEDEPKPFRSLKHCSSWSAPQSVSCQGPDGAFDCKVAYPYQISPSLFASQYEMSVSVAMV